MRKRVLSVLLCAVLVLSLAACGGKDTADTEPAADSTGDSEQAEEPEATPEPTPTPTPEPEAAPVLDLLKKEYESGLAFGQTKDRTFVPGLYINEDNRSSIGAVADGDTVYVLNTYGAEDKQGLYAYDIPTKTAELCTDFPKDLFYKNCLGYLDGWFYFWDYNGIIKVNRSGENAASPAISGSITPVMFENGILYSDANREQYAVLSLDTLQITATIPAPQQEAKHGIMEMARLDENSFFAADGTVYVASGTNLFKLDTENSVWADQGALPEGYKYNHGWQLCGRYFTDGQKIFDRITNEEVFTYGVLYKSTVGDDYKTLSYFGGDEYIGVSRSGGVNEYRWVNLKDSSMSEPFQIPENTNTTIVDDTYCVYRDSYGVFLWNYITGEEETIVLFEQ